MKLGVDKDTAWITAYTGKRIAYVCQRSVGSEGKSLDIGQGE